LLGLAELGASFADFAVDLGAHSVKLFLRFDARFFERRLCLAMGIFEELLRFQFGAGESGRAEVAPKQESKTTTDDRGNYDVDKFHLVPSVRLGTQKKPGDMPGFSRGLSQVQSEINRRRQAPDKGRTRRNLPNLPKRTCAAQSNTSVPRHR